MADGEELAALIAPLSAEELVSSYWEKKPFSLTGRSERLAGLFDRHRFDAALAGASMIRSYFRQSGGPGVQARIQPHEVAGVVEAGGTVCASDICRGDPALALFAATIKRQLGHAGVVRCNSYLSPDGSGFDLHFDARVSMTLQIAGKKRWDYSARPALVAPLRDALPGDQRPQWPAGPAPSPPPEGLESVLLEPGDVLCLPSGIWHRVQAVGESLSLNLAFERGDPWALLRSVLEPMLYQREAWRRLPPPRTMTNGGALPSEISGFLSERIDELRTLLAELDSTQLERAWRGTTLRILDREAAEPRVRTPLATPLAPTDLIAHDGHLSYAALARTKSGVLLDGHTGMEIEIGSLAFLDTLVRTRRFAAGDALRWCDGERWENVASVLTTLIEFGVLERVRADDR